MGSLVSLVLLQQALGMDRVHPIGGWQWAADLALVWVGVLPFVALGIAIGSFANSTVAYAASTGLWFAFSALGGLWVPPGVLSPDLRHLAVALPSYNQAALGWHVTSGTAPTITNAMVLAAWTAGLSLLALAATTRRRRRAAGTASSPAAQSSGSAAVGLSGVAVRYGDVTAVDGLDLRVPAGQIMALLGSNGAGKTTTMSILLGLRPADRGDVRVFGAAPRRAAASGQVGVMLQDSELMAGVSVGELLRFVARLYPAPLDLAAVAGAVDLDGLLRRRTDRLSGGQAQRVRFALALAGDPDLLVLDEPTAGRVVLIGAGRVAADGTPAQVKAATNTGRVVRFRILDGGAERFAGMPAVTGVNQDGPWVTLHTGDADATVWALYKQRRSIAEIAVTGASLEEAFLSLVTGQP